MACILSEMATGRALFPGDSEAALSPGARFVKRGSFYIVSVTMRLIEPLVGEP